MVKPFCCALFPPPVKLRVSSSFPFHRFKKKLLMAHVHACVVCVCWHACGGHRTTFAGLVFLLPPLCRFGDSSSGHQAITASMLTGLRHLASPSILFQRSLLTTLLFLELFTQKARLPQVPFPSPSLSPHITMHLDDLSGVSESKQGPSGLIRNKN